MILENQLFENKSLTQKCINLKFKGKCKSMLPYCLKCKKDIESVDLKVLKTKNGRLFLSSKCALNSSKKSRLIREQEAKGLLSTLGLRTPLNEIPLLSEILF